MYSAKPLKKCDYIWCSVFKKNQACDPRRPGCEKASLSQLVKNPDRNAVWYAHIPSALRLLEVMFRSTLQGYVHQGSA